MSTDVLSETERAESERALNWLRAAATDGGSVTLSPGECCALAKRLRLAEAAAPRPVLYPTGAVLRVVGGGFAPLTEAERQRLRVGDEVAVQMDSGDVRRFAVRTAPWRVHGDLWLVGLEGIPGGYDLARVRGKKVPA